MRPSTTFLERFGARVTVVPVDGTGHADGYLLAH
jgi:hypothetical protein